MLICYVQFLLGRCAGRVRDVLPVVHDTHAQGTRTENIGTVMIPNLSKLF